MEPVDDFTAGYLQSAAFVSCRDDIQRGLGSAPFSDEFIAQAVADCRAFQAANRALLDLTGSVDDLHGQAFWLTRNRYGTRFWNRADDGVGDALTTAARGFPRITCYLGEDGKIYGIGGTNGTSG